MTVTLTPNRFLSLWTAAGYDDFPFPLRYRTTTLWEDDHAADMRAADKWRCTTDTYDISRTLAALAGGDVAVEVHGRATDSRHDVYVRAAVTGDRAVLAHQAPNAGDIHLVTCTTDLLPRALLERLPPVAAGREPARSAPAHDVIDPSITGVRQAVHDTTAQALRRLLQRERSGTGSIRVLVRADPGYRTVADLGWFDVLDDGRYLFFPGTDTRVAPATPDAMRRELTRLVHHARQLPSTHGRPGPHARR